MWQSVNKLKVGLVLAAAALTVAPLLAYNIRLKDGSLIFARAPYEIKGTKAIITLQNGTVTQIDLQMIDIPGTDRYNRENPGNVIAIVPGETKDFNPIVTPVPTTSLQDIIRQRKMRLDGSPKTSASGELSGSGSWQQADPAVEAAFRKTFDDASITQYRLTNYRGKLRLIATTNSEEAVFTALSAAARSLAALAEKGKNLSVDIALTTSSGEPAGSFAMTSDQARLIVGGGIPVADFFVRNVIL